MGNAFTEYFIAYLEDGVGEYVTSPCGEIVLVYEFLDIFSYIHGLPPIIETEFSINLIPSTTPIHQASN